MSGARTCSLLGGALAALLGALVLLAAADTARAEMRPGTAEIKRVTGRVEVLRKGQSQWAPAAVGAKLAEGDEIRSFAGGSAELELPDTSSLLVAENTRLAVTKLVVDSQGQTRLSIFHLAVGKVRAVVAQAAIMLVRARQTNFAISTPTGVAAARGTDYSVATDGRGMMVAVYRGAAIFADNLTRTPVMVGANSVATQRGNAPPSAPLPFTALPASTQAALPTLAYATDPAGAAAFVAPSTPLPAFAQVVGVMVAASVKIAPGETRAVVFGLVASDPESAGAVVSSAIESGGDRGAVASAAIGAGGSSAAVTTAALAIGAASPTPAAAEIAASPLTPAPSTTVGTDLAVTSTTPTSP